ncbi:MAG: HlyD family efflux transporter periplasmic adaptor subunit, partial [Acidimicrobiales bacterium]|nr:HlyD family efflux transporter periplasmic adaptor subunit [Acidimicrobiales bacterium]
MSLSLALVATACGGSTPTQPTTTVQRGEVATRVSASGALASVSSQNLGFPKGAQLKEVDVKVGDKVQPGQVLARLDGFAFQQTLNQQQAQLNQQQAQLDKIINGTTVGGARRTLDQAKEILDATRRNVDAVNSFDKASTQHAQVQLNYAESQYDAARRDPAADDCPPNGKPAPPTSPTPMSGTAPSSSVLAPLTTTTGNTTTDMRTQPNCSTVASTKLNLITARSAYIKAKKQEDVDETQGRVSIENARQSVVSAQNTLDSSSTDQPSNIAAQRALVASQAAVVALARKDLANTVLYAPIAGTVASVNGAVGEFVGTSTSLTPLAPGTDAAIPGVGAAATSQQTATSGNSTSAGTSISRSFIVLNNVNTFQVVVPFEESDAAKVAPNQQVEVTFDAIPDLTRTGTVLSIAPAGTDISGVTNYYATIILTETDPRLRDGQTAQAGVMTRSLQNVLTVPNNAVTKQGGRSFVNTPGPDGKPQQTPFQPGLVGDNTTEVKSGLTEGQQILLPQAQV